MTKVDVGRPNSFIIAACIPLILVGKGQFVQKRLTSVKINNVKNITFSYETFHWNRCSLRIYSLQIKMNDPNMLEANPDCFHVVWHISHSAYAKAAFLSS